jgi:hypothetical protein
MMASEFDITTAMVEAGAAVLRAELGGAVKISWQPDLLAVAVFWAMIGRRAAPDSHAPLAPPADAPYERLLAEAQAEHQGD